MPESPNISDEEGERPSGFPGARLKHTQTIMGGRTGGLGLRTSAKRQSMSKRMSMSSNSNTPRASDVTVQNFVGGGALKDGRDLEMPDPKKEVNGLMKLPDEPEQSGSSSVKVDVNVVEPTVQEEAPVQRVVQFIPKFKNAKEMEEKRRERMAARRRGPNGALAGPAAPSVPQPPQPQHSLSFDTSSDEDMVHVEADSSSDSDFGDIDDGDEFDPEFTARGIHSDSISDASLPSVGTSSVVGYMNNARPRLSPVTEGTTGQPNHHNHAPHTQRSASDASTNTSGAKSSRRPAPRSSNSNSSIQLANSSSSVPQASSSTPSEVSLFTRKRVAPLRPQKSSLSAMIAASSSSSNNPFTEIYSAISGRGEAAATNVLVFFPHCKSPAKGMDLNVRKDATVEEVIGFALWTYWEEGWLPRLDEGLNEEKDKEKWEVRMSGVGWIMRIAEEDGEVDDDFPPPDRTGKIARFNGDAYAVLEATPAQIAQNQILESKIQRPTKVKKPSGDKSASNLNLPLAQGGPGSTSASLLAASALGGSVPLSTSLGPSTQGPQMFLRIRIADQADAVHFMTTIPVSSGMYMQEVLEAVCRKRSMANSPSDYALLLSDLRIFVPLDRTVASLQGKRELDLVKRSSLPDMGVDVFRAGRTTDPNASILKRMSDAPEAKLAVPLDYRTAYKKYTVYRKLPMLVTRQEKTLAIDGGYLHIMPPTTNRAAKGVFDSGRTTSFHIKSISECQQSNKSPHMFKLVLNRASGDKRYYFEAENSKSAGEIVQTVKSLKNALDRSSTIKARRSRQVV
ncbi:Component of a membrane-bound complex containing the Tor2p kinase [Marasmius sp. AFHP31]|nr:Component of a membrane-bound complex containing the Tor2p kinase [Marasmius sp. AFHP31]